MVLCTANHTASFAHMDEQQRQRQVEVCQDCYQALSSLVQVQYVFIFENKGEVIGVTLTTIRPMMYPDLNWHISARRQKMSLSA